MQDVCRKIHRCVVICKKAIHKCIFRSVKELREPLKIHSTQMNVWTFPYFRDNTEMKTKRGNRIGGKVEK